MVCGKRLRTFRSRPFRVRDDPPGTGGRRPGSGLEGLGDPGTDVSEVVARGGVPALIEVLGDLAQRALELAAGQGGQVGVGSRRVEIADQDLDEGALEVAPVEVDGDRL